MTIETSDQNEPQTAAPFALASLLDLYLRPVRYFANDSNLADRRVLFVAAGLMGIASVIGKIDQKIIQAELGHPSRGWEEFSPWLLTSWANYWLMVLIAGSVGAVIYWYLGGWWYKKRLNWSGVADASAVKARSVYVTQGLVSAAPVVMLALIQTILFSNYAEVWQSDEIWSSSILLFVFWSCWVSYCAAITAFPATRLKASIWFLVLPVLLYVITLGIVGALYSFVVGNVT